MEGPSREHRVLARHGVDHEERVVRCRDVADRADLGHEGLVDRQTPGGVDDDDVAPQTSRLGESPARDLHRIAGLAEDVDAYLAGEHPQLLDRRGTLQVSRHEVRLAALLLEPRRELRRRRSLTGALEPGEQDHRGWPRGVRDFEGRPSEDFDELFVHGLDDLLARREALAEDLAAQAIAHRVEEGAHDAEFDVGFEQRSPHFEQRVVEVGVAEAPARAQRATQTLESFTQRIKHGS